MFERVEVDLGDAEETHDLDGVGLHDKTRIATSPTRGRKAANWPPATFGCCASTAGGMVFTEEAVVHHKLFDYRAGFRWPSTTTR